MKKQHILAILFFGGLWGLSEAILGDWLYSRGDPRYAAIPLAVIGFAILSIARVYFPQKGMPTLIAACAMLYKFLNEPLFACHFLGILLLGVAYDLIFNVASVKNRALAAATAVYLGHASFALLITYIIRYQPWVEAGLPKVLTHIFIAGSLTALACAITVPLAHKLAQRLHTLVPTPFAWQPQLAPSAVSFVALAVWGFGIAVYLTHIAQA